MKLIVFVVTSLAATAAALACTCGGGGPFMQAARNSEIVVYGVVSAHERHGMDVEIVQLLRGQEQRAAIRVWGDPGSLCRSSINRFPVGSQWLLALTTDDVKISGEAKDDYVIRSCAEFSLQVTGGTVYLQDRSARLQISAIAAEIRGWDSMTDP